MWQVATISDVVKGVWVLGLEFSVWTAQRILTAWWRKSPHWHQFGRNATHLADDADTSLPQSSLFPSYSRCAGDPENEISCSHLISSKNKAAFSAHKGSALGPVYFFKLRGRESALFSGESRSAPQPVRFWCQVDSLSDTQDCVRSSTKSGKRGNLYVTSACGKGGKYCQLAVGEEVERAMALRNAWLYGGTRQLRLGGGLLSQPVRTTASMTWTPLHPHQPRTPSQRNHLKWQAISHCVRQHTKLYVVDRESKVSWVLLHTELHGREDIIHLFAPWLPCSLPIVTAFGFNPCGGLDDCGQQKVSACGWVSPHLQQECQTSRQGHLLDWATVRTDLQVSKYSFRMQRHTRQCIRLRKEKSASSVAWTLFPSFSSSLGPFHFTSY